MDNINSINTWMYYVQNYTSVAHNKSFVPSVLAEAKFNASREHIIGKFLERIDVGINGSDALNELYFEVDDECKRSMIEWVLENYKTRQI